jgi:hypothetical protein
LSVPKQQFDDLWSAHEQLRARYALLEKAAELAEEWLDIECRSQVVDRSRGPDKSLLLVLEKLREALK